MSYRRSYLWASADIDIQGRKAHDGLGPTTLTFLADDAAIHLRRAERYTVVLHRDTVRTPLASIAFQRQTLHLANAVTASLRQRHPHLDFTDRLIPYGRAVVAVQFIPDNEWHPDYHKSDSKPWVLSCDASWRNPRQARVGITRAGGFSARVDLAPAEPATNTHAEFLGLCLAMITRTDLRMPLLIGCDQETAVRDAKLLTKGILPPWIHQKGNDLAQRIAIAAMTSTRLRPVIIRQVPRRKVTKADEVATYSTDKTGVLHPKTWANKQKMPLSWVDAHRGLGRPLQLTQ